MANFYPMTTFLEETMERRVEIVFGGLEYINGEMLPPRIDSDEIKQFVRTEIRFALQNAREKVSLREHTTEGIGTDVSWVNGYNSALAEIERKWEKLLETN